MTRPACPAKAVCPRTGRHPMRRKKNCLAVGIVLLMVFGFLQLVYEGDGYSALRPLADAESEGRRLLKMITHYHYMCNSTFQVGNRSHWPICTDRQVGLDLESREANIMYSVGWSGDLWLEKTLVGNYSVKLYIISPDLQMQALQQMNNTFAIQKMVVPNDVADFSRNSYEQQTLNDLMTGLGHSHINLLQLINLNNNNQMWELLHFMINDNLLYHVDQLQIAMYIDKLEEDFLYSWYRNLYELFYKEQFRLIHTASSDSLCVQVTMMQSCMYYMTWVRSPGSQSFVSHPPALYGRSIDEEQRLVSYMSQVQMECKQHVIGGKKNEQLTFSTTQDSPRWPVCSLGGLQHTFTEPCSVVRFRANNDFFLEGEMIAEGCNIITIEPVINKFPDSSIEEFKVHSHHPKKKKVPTATLR